MRITDSILSKSVVNSINQSKERLGELQNVLSTGKKINKPSDEPLNISSLFSFRKSLQDVEQYLKNVEIATSWIDSTSHTLTEILQVLTDARTVVLRESNATSTEDSRKVAAQEIRNLHQQLLNLAISTFGGKYIFSGTSTRTRPFTQDGEYKGDNGEIKIQIDDRTSVTVNVPGSRVFKEEEDVFALFSDLEKALEEGEIQISSSEFIQRLDRCIDCIQRWQGEVGGRGKRVEVFRHRLEDRKVALTKLSSMVEDADTVKIVTELQHALASYQAALYAGRMILQLTLIDYWK